MGRGDMNAAELMADLTSKGITLAVRGDKLQCQGREAPLIPELQAILKGRRAELIAFLLSQRASSAEISQESLGEVTDSTEVNPAVGALLSRLQAGSQWLTAQHQAWIDEVESAVSDQKFSRALAAWIELERELRALGFEGCIFLGPGGQCPEDTPVSCDFCVTD
jgi:hypothetical protein